MDWTRLQLLYSCGLIMIHTSYVSRVSSIARRVGDLPSIIDGILQYTSRAYHKTSVHANLAILTNLRDSYQQRARSRPVGNPRP